MYAEEGAELACNLLKYKILLITCILQQMLTVLLQLHVHNHM